ncbi:carbon-nitrogen hydrolase family protein [Kitasatospora aureofaciens]|uniref:carbon-nitrogen hydrolase family protein n=1 Tax=Kitasatospora aureofaciens TaxID=1894 RepID=UPI001C4969E8|nr:carbon-nitrogen hydrolase family protein [Kitasatospora aureofaciens]MBV6697261.1 carbon-nitrogen hydrolase family protein [Kitasatospora aureofaciens]
MPASLTVAVAQPACAEGGRPDTVAVNVGRHADAVREAGTRLVVFPELSLTGYDLSAPALDPADARLAPLVAACAETGATALVGAPVAAPDGRESIATLAVTGEGASVAYRKMRLHGDELNRFAAGDKPVVLEVDGVRLGLAICADAADPGHAEETAALGIDAYVASTLYGAAPESAARRDGHFRDRSAAHGVWSVLSTSAGASGEFPATSGGSGFWAPGGAPAAQAGTEPGELVTARLP